MPKVIWLEFNISICIWAKHVAFVNPIVGTWQQNRILEVAYLRFSISFASSGVASVFPNSVTIFFTLSINCAFDSAF